MHIMALKKDLVSSNKVLSYESEIKPVHPINKTVGEGEKLHASDKSSLTNVQADALKVLTFTGQGFRLSPHIKLEARFINDLANTQNAKEKAAVAEMLGRAKSINSITHLLTMIDTKEDNLARMSAITALGEIGDATHVNSFTRNQIGNKLIQFYKELKQELANPPVNKPVDLSQLFSQEASSEELFAKELKVLLKAIGKIKTSEGEALLEKEYVKALGMANEQSDQLEDIIQALRNAEKGFIKNLEKQYKKPISKIKEKMLPDEMEKLASKVEIKSKHGVIIGLTNTKVLIQLMKSQNEIANNLLNGSFEGLAELNNKKANDYLKLGLQSSNSKIKARSLRILGQRNTLSYNSEIYPNLISKSPVVRQAALSATTHSNELEAKQKLMECLNPDVFFTTTGSAPDAKGLEKYVGFLKNMANNSEKYIESLYRIASTQDIDLNSRKVALLVLGMSATGSQIRHTNPNITETATTVIRMMALQPKGQTVKEKDEICYMASKLWLATKEPDAVANAFNLLNNPSKRLPVELQEDLLMTLFGVFLKNPIAATHINNLKHNLLNILESQPKSRFKKETIEDIRSQIKNEAKDKLLNIGYKNEMHAEPSKEDPDTVMVEKLKPYIDILRPPLIQMLDHKASPIARVAAARILGVLQDNNKETVKKLIEQTRDPLKGLMDWKADLSIKLPPTEVGKIVRGNNIKALGSIGDAEALDVMLDAMDDPGLKGATLVPLEKLAKNVNLINDPASIQKITQKLINIMENPDNTRTARALRIASANALFQYNGGVDKIKQFIQTTPDLNFKRHAIAALIMNDYAVDPTHADHEIVKNLIQPELGVEKLHKQGLTGKGVEIAVVDGGYVDRDNKEAFQDRVKLPASIHQAEDYHPTMVATTAAGNGKIKGVAPDAIIYSDKWPELDGENPFDVYKKIIEGKLRGENNISVINNSWGFTSNDVVSVKKVRDALKHFKTVVDMAEKADIQIVFSAGNAGENSGYPSLGSLSVFGMDVDKLTDEQQKDLDYILDKIILVGASNTQGVEDRNKHLLASFSSKGDSLNRKLIPTVLAPGVDMMVYGYDDGDKRPKELVNGTSFSGPYASAMIGLIKQANPKLKPEQIREIVKTTAVKLPYLPDAYQGYGEVDPVAAVDKAKNFVKKSS